MADSNDDLMAQFQEFLTAKAAQDKEAADADDEEIEIWDEKGRGARVRRSRAKPFLQTLGIDLDPEPEPDGDKPSGAKPKGKPTGPAKTNATSGSVARKYFTKPA